MALEERTLPSATEIDLRRNERRTEELVSKLKKSLAVDKLDKDSRNQAVHLLERDDAIELVQILLAHYQKPSRQQPVESFGGLLKEVPKPERVAPGSRKRPSKESLAEWQQFAESIAACRAVKLQRHRTLPRKIPRR